MLDTRTDAGVGSALLIEVSRFSAELISLLVKVTASAMEVGVTSTDNGVVVISALASSVEPVSPVFELGISLVVSAESVAINDSCEVSMLAVTGTLTVASVGKAFASSDLTVVMSD